MGKYSPELADKIHVFPLREDKAARVRARRGKKRKKLSGKVEKLVKRLIRRDWSPEQISGRLELEKGRKIVSHETIYKLVREDKEQGGNLYKHMRHQLKHRKKYGSIQRHFIKNKRCISTRPEVVDKKERIGDWEIDTVISEQKKGAVLVTMVGQFKKQVQQFC